MTIRKAVILAAGYGTRFLPVTKAMPKEMLPVVDKPVIQHVVEDAVSAGIKDIVIVTSAQKRPLEDHFDHSFELESVLGQGGKTELLEQVKYIADMANFIYVRQKRAKGTIPAIQSGYQAIGDEPFLTLFGDDIFMATPNRCQQLVAAYEKYGAPILGAFETTNPEDTKRYGYAAGDEVEPGIIKVKEIVEKPGPDKVPSDLAVVSGYIFTPEFMTYTDKTPAMANGEYGYTDALKLMVNDGKPMYAVKIKNGTYYDCGNKMAYLKANIELALQDSELGPELRTYLESLAARHNLVITRPSTISK